MSVTFMSIKVANPLKPLKNFDRRFLVDTGAIFSVVPERELVKLGIKADSVKTFVLANGEEMEKKIGEAKFYWKEISRTAPVVFGEEGVYLLGATTLEAMGLSVDPVNRELHELPMLL